MYDDAYEETVKSSELDETEYSRRMKKTRFVAATLPVLEGMTDRLLDPATVRTEAPQSMLLSIFVYIDFRSGCRDHPPVHRPNVFRTGGDWTNVVQDLLP